jgi:hypothetical protein
MAKTARRMERDGAPRRFRGGLLGALLLLAPTAARADEEVWFWAETRVPVVRTEKPAFPRLDWRIFADFRANRRSEGLAQGFLRNGPLFFPTSWMFVGLHGVIYSDRLASGAHEQEARLELEPNLFGRVGSFTFNDRNRGEYRWREREERFRYRNQLRVSYAPPGARWIPFVWDEVLVDLSGLGFNQNRAEIGLGWMMTETSRLDVGYLLRSREEKGQWIHDHILNVYFFFDVPRKTPSWTAAVPASPPPVTLPPR